MKKITKPQLLFIITALLILLLVTAYPANNALQSDNQISLPARGFWDASKRGHKELLECTNLQTNHAALRIKILNRRGKKIKAYRWRIPSLGTKRFKVNRLKVERSKRGTFILESLKPTEIPSVLCYLTASRRSKTRSSAGVQYMHSLPFGSSINSKSVGFLGLPEGTAVARAALSIQNSGSNPFFATIDLYDQNGNHQRNRSARIGPLKPGVHYKHILCRKDDACSGSFIITPESLPEKSSQLPAEAVQLGSYQALLSISGIAKRGEPTPLHLTIPKESYANSTPLSYLVSQTTTTEIQILNSESHPTDIKLILFSEQGEMISSGDLTIPANAIRAIKPELSETGTETGFVTIHQSDDSPSLLVRSFQVKKDSSSESILISEANGQSDSLAKTMAFPINTNRSAQNNLILFSKAAEQVDISLRLFDLRGASIAISQPTLSFKGRLELNLNNYLGENVTGTLVITTNDPSGSKAITGHLARTFLNAPLAQRRETATPSTENRSTTKTISTTVAGQIIDKAGPYQNAENNTNPACSVSFNYILYTASKTCPPCQAFERWWHNWWEVGGNKHNKPCLSLEIRDCVDYGNPREPCKSQRENSPCTGKGFPCFVLNGVAYVGSQQAAMTNIQCKYCACAGDTGKAQCYNSESFKGTGVEYGPSCNGPNCGGDYCNQIMGDQCATPTPTSTPSPSATNTVAATSTPTPVITATLPTSTPTKSPTPSATPSASATPTITHTPTITATPSPSATATPTPKMVVACMETNHYCDGESCKVVPKGFWCTLVNESEADSGQIAGCSDEEPGKQCATPTATATGTPTKSPTNTPTKVPTATPTKVPTNTPTKIPTNTPTKVPTNTPTKVPTNTPTKVPTNTPTKVPTNTPTKAPTNTPTKVPTNTPTKAPTNTPTKVPTNTPTKVPTNTPTKVPTNTPTKVPTNTPTKVPTNTPTKAPTNTPTKVPTNTPTKVPTNTPTKVPTNTPTKAPTNTPTKVPTNTPTKVPTNTPTKVPTNTPTKVPTNTPTKAPTNTPTKVPTNTPTKVPTNTPTKVPTNTPTKIPTATPTKVPTNTPTKIPTNTPTKVPTSTPTKIPTATPTKIPTNTPTKVPTNTPTKVPTNTPTKVPTSTPTKVPTNTPTKVPTSTPTKIPTATPTKVPTNTPTKAPTSTPVTTPEPSITPNSDCRTAPSSTDFTCDDETAPANPNADNDGDGIGDCPIDGQVWQHVDCAVNPAGGTIECNDSSCVCITDGPGAGEVRCGCWGCGAPPAPSPSPTYETDWE